jgi:hypothetical protein
MTQAPFRRISLLLLAGFAFALTTSGGCSRMSEGERCDFTNAGDQDCDDGLECVPADQLVNGAGADRCCPPVNESSGDSRCQRGTPITPTTGGTSGAGGTGGSAAGAAGESSMGGTPSGGEGGQPPGAMAGDGGMSGAGTSAAGMGGV